MSRKGAGGYVDPTNIEIRVRFVPGKPHSPNPDQHKFELESSNWKGHKVQWLFDLCLQLHEKLQRTSVNSSFPGKLSTHPSTQMAVLKRKQLLSNLEERPVLQQSRSL